LSEEIKEKEYFVAVKRLEGQRFVNSVGHQNIKTKLQRFC